VLDIATEETMWSEINKPWTASEAICSSYRWSTGRNLSDPSQASVIVLDLPFLR
jgi:hypothetical protein